ncbi:ABC transporter ATP-binding protein [Jongsikchunia kroppenstedtii]|uniref:ABC transporter ATP-binding protein n=1 Tax=Jongsikchunia kroppenstedtii TaxID=1121721 RepID=UPI00036FE8EB|nr:ABC transporter ATP-binding protein [Jongsikchunia kroppenstedtii]
MSVPPSGPNAGASAARGAAGTQAVAARAEQLTKVYGSGDTTVEALRQVDVAFAAGEFTAIMGPSGSGKSTLMHCLAGLDASTSGRVTIGDTDLSALNDKQTTLLRRDRIGFVFQAFNLVPTLTAKENITLPLDIAGRKPDQAWFDAVIDRLGLRDRLSHRPSELSGGQQQRVACARALVGRPDIIFGDEPTGNLDSRSSGEVMSILRAAVDEFQQTVIIVTHDPRAASYADRVVFLADGRIVNELRHPSADDVFEYMKHLDDPAQQAQQRPATTPPPAPAAPVAPPAPAAQPNPPSAVDHLNQSPRPTDPISPADPIPPAQSNWGPPADGTEAPDGRPGRHSRG